MIKIQKATLKGSTTGAQCQHQKPSFCHSQGWLWALSTRAMAGRKERLSKAGRLDPHLTTTTKYLACWTVVRGWQGTRTAKTWRDSFAVYLPVPSACKPQVKHSPACGRPHWAPGRYFSERLPEDTKQNKNTKAVKSEELEV